MRCCLGFPPSTMVCKCSYELRRGTKVSTWIHPEITDKMYQKILTDPLVFGPEFGSEARSILTSLLDRDPTKRLGVSGAEEIKKHPFFEKHIDFKKLLQKKIQPPFKPSVSSPVVRSLSRFGCMLRDQHFATCYTGRVQL